MSLTPIPALPENHCLGLQPDGVKIDRKMLCVKGFDDAGNPIKTCATWRLFKANCPKINVQCSVLSSAYVAAVTCCNQKLFN